MISTKEILWGLHHLHGLLVMDMRRWWKYLSGGRRSAPTSRIGEAKLPSCMPLAVDMCERLKYCSGGGGGDPGVIDKDGRTSLSYAAGDGYGMVVKLLLEQEEVNPDLIDNIGRTPLSYAAGGRYEGVVKLLLQRERSIPT